jgi:hypothetical protein
MRLPKFRTPRSAPRTLRIANIKPGFGALSHLFDFSISAFQNIGLAANLRSAGCCGIVTRVKTTVMGLDSLCPTPWGMLRG